MTDKWVPKPSFDPDPVVKSDYRRNLHYPEVLFFGANYAVGLECSTREEALARAEQVVSKLKEELNQVVKKFSETYSVAKP